MQEFRRVQHLKAGHQGLDEHAALAGFLVAFTGSVKDEDSGPEEFTEASMNVQLRGQEPSAAFKQDEYRILLVTNKYQVGFDQPLLHIMYVDKRLSGVLAVQTLSRLNRTAPGKEETISERPVIAGTVASYTVKTELKERSLAAVGSATSMAFERDLSAPVLPVRMVPYHQPKGTSEWLPHLPNAGYFDTKTGIEMQYDLRLLQVKRTQDDKQRASSEQFRAASVTAFTVLVYVVLWELQAQIRRAVPDAGMVLLRLQHTGRQNDSDADADDANTAVYAASQAIEKALAREGFPDQWLAVSVICPPRPQSADPSQAGLF